MNRETDDLRSSTGARAPHDSIRRARRGGWRRDIRLLLLLAAAWAAPAMAQVPPAFPGCDTRAFLFQGTPTNVVAIDLVTGASTQVGTNIAPPNLNGVAYNPLDNYVYGVSNTPGATLGRVYRVGADFSVQDLGLPTGLPAAGYNIGEFDGNGHYWVTTSADSTTVYEVDLKPGSATYFRVVNSRAMTVPAGFSGTSADWAYNPVDGFLYRTPRNTTTNRLHLFRYNRSTGALTNLGPVAGVTVNVSALIGANYADAGGFIYASDNVTGEIYRVNTTNNTGVLFSTGPASGTNDGARCFNAPVPVDFGDAPNSYGTLLANNGARHSIPGYNAAAKTATLMLGSRITADADGQPDANAALDTFDDGLDPASLVLTTGATTASAVVSAINAKATPATLAGWIDFNKNGTFDAGERAQVTVPANTTTATPFTLNWSGLAAIPAGFNSLARFRIATNGAQVAASTGAASDGEVEDYVVPIKQPIGCATNPSVFNTAINAAGTGVLVGGSRDRNWEVGLGTPTGGPASVPSWIQAYVVGNAAPGSWATSPFGNADWTSYFSNTIHTGNVEEYHRYRFTLDGAVDPSTFALGIDFYADNSVWEVYVNGQPQSGLIAGLPQSPTNPYFYGGFVSANRAQLVLNHNWRSGPNEIVVQVRSAPAAVGFLAQVTSTSLCPIQVGIDKSVDPPGALTPGGTVTYTVTATNTGNVSAPNTIVTDPLPNGIVSGTWTCAATSGAVCPNASGAMPLNQTIATFPGGGVATYTIVGQVAGSPPASVTNTASASPPGTGTCYPGNGQAPCTASVANPPVPVIAVTKATTATQAIPGATLTYEIRVQNTGSIAADGATIADPVPAGLGGASWTCVSSGGALCPNASGSGAINETIAVFPAGGELLYAVTATVDANPPAAIANTATTTPPGGGICSDGSAPPCDSTVILPAAPQVRVTKSANPPGALTAGGTVTYTVTAFNEGSVPAPATHVVDTFPAGIVSATWTCAATGGAACPNAGSGGTVTPPADLLNETIAIFPPGSSVTYTIAATVAAAPPAQVVNTVAVTPPDGLCLPDNTQPPCTSTVSNPPAQAQITIVKEPTALDNTPFAFTTTAAAPDDAFTLSSGTALTRTFSAAPGTVSISEGASVGWVLIDLVCTNASGSATFTYTGATANPSNGFERGDDTANVTVGFGDQVTCTYTNAPTALPTLAKFFNTDPPSDPAPQPPVIPRSGAALLTFVISNRAPSAVAQSALAFTDTLPSGLVLANGSAPPSALVGANTCGGTVTAQAGTNAISLAGGSVAAGADCSFTVRVAAAP